MAKFKERRLPMTEATATVTADVTKLDLNDIGAGDHFHLTPTRVDTNTAGTETGQIDYSGTEATQTSNIQTAIQALGGIYASATVANGTTAQYKVVTVPAGYDVTWAITNASGFTGGTSTETTPGKVRYVGTIPIGRFAVVKRLILDNFADNSLDVTITDANSKTVFSKTALDTYNSGDVMYDKMLTADGVAGEDGAAAANVSSGLFEGPLTVTVDTSAPSTTGTVIIVAEMGRSAGYRLRSSGAISGTTGEISLGATYANIKRIYLKASADTTVSPSIADAWGKVVYTKTSTDYTTAVNESLSMEGIDQAANAVADTLDVVAKSPLTVTLTGLGSGTFEVRVYTDC
jgi:hypothetical protein